MPLFFVCWCWVWFWSESWVQWMYLVISRSHLIHQHSAAAGAALMSLISFRNSWIKHHLVPMGPHWGGMQGKNWGRFRFVVDFIKKQEATGNLLHSRRERRVTSVPRHSYSRLLIAAYFPGLSLVIFCWYQASYWLILYQYWTLVQRGRTGMS